MKQHQQSLGKNKGNQPISIVLADDHAVLRSGLRLLISGHTDMEVLGEAGNFSEAVNKVTVLRPNVVIMDITMPGDDPFIEIKRVLETSPNSRVLVLSMHEDGAYLRRALEAGASGYVCKKVADTELISAVRAVYEGRTFVDLRLENSEINGIQNSEILAQEFEGVSEKAKTKLSRREKEVLILVAKGHTNQQIAGQLKVGIKSVETYRGRVMEKLDLRDRAELVEYVIQNQLL